MPITFSPDMFGNPQAYLDTAKALQNLMGTAEEQTRASRMAPYDLQLAQLKIPYLQNQISQQAQDLQQSQQMAPYKLDQLRLANQETRNLAPYRLAKEKALSDIAAMKARYPLLQSSGDERTIGAVNYLRNNGMGQLADKLLQGLDISQQEKQSLGNLASERSKNYVFSKLTPDEKANAFAYARSANIPTSELMQGYAQGRDIKQQLADRGFDISNVNPSYAPKGQIVAQQQKREAAKNEMDSISNDVTNAIAPYSRQFGDDNPKLVIDSLQGKNNDALGKYLAARALNPELSAMRLNAFGGNVGIEAIKHIGAVTFGNLAAYRSLITPEVFKRSQQYLDDWIARGVEAAGKTALNPYAKQSSSTSSPDVSRRTNSYFMKGPDGRVFEVSGNKRGLFEQNGYKVINNG
jgi:hypothetical protein